MTRPPARRCGCAAGRVVLGRGRRLEPIEQRWRSTCGARTCGDAGTQRAASRVAAAQDGIALDTVAVDREDVGALLIEERIDIDAHRVVAPGLIPIDAVRADQLQVGIVRVDAEVQIFAVIGDIHFGLLGRRRAVERLLLEELADARGGAPDRIVETAVEPRRLVGPDGGERGSAAEHARRDGRTGRAAPPLSCSVTTPDVVPAGTRTTRRTTRSQQEGWRREKAWRPMLLPIDGERRLVDEPLAVISQGGEDSRRRRGLPGPDLSRRRL